MNFILAMLLNPTFAEKARVEIDGVVGRERLPSADDFESLPYLHAVFKEVLRCVHHIQFIHAFEGLNVSEWFASYGTAMPYNWSRNCTSDHEASLKLVHCQRAYLRVKSVMILERLEDANS